MMTFARWRLSAALALGAELTLSCGTSSEKMSLDPSGAEEQQAGHLSVALVSAQDAFRLSFAVFSVVNRTRSQTLTLDTSGDPAAAALEADLLQGTYDITLQDGWVLERVVEAGTPVPVRAALLTPNPTEFEVENGQVKELVYSFSTDEGVVTLGRGAVSINVNVAPTASLTGCNLLARSSCAAGQTCLLANASGSTFCGAPGSLEIGAPCSSEQCVAGAQCLYLDAEHPDAGVCTRFCRPASAFCGCQGLSFDSSVGVCTEASRDVAFNFTSNNCRLIDHQLVSSDDRGGIAVSDDFVYYTGDSQTARFNLADLGNAVGLSRTLDGIVQDLDSGSLYSLSTDGALFTNFCGGGSFTRLLQHAPSDASVERAIPLSQAVPNECSSGVFAGPGFLLLATSSRVFQIEFDSGTVTDLGPRPPLPSQTCENWAFWGIAERAGGEVRMVYVGNNAQIMRTSMAGVTEVAATFGNLADMCSITVSRPLARWYFHHEGGSQFGGSSESIGYCDAVEQ